ncbi:GNAT family N-acetyltransferase [uncultured Pseudokineococcus sp.]|uniref:GNAT family N-acetyltransferase n=1 Tax=uncultured Pseudokineococcus sp. TaxID=1642928 RepID=UPI002603005E|nr:GNAT family N-acetyltransferase [uncultured Pseudokineococcus sp.]
MSAASSTTAPVTAGTARSALGTWTFAPLRVDGTTPLDDATLLMVHAWVTAPRSVFWQMQGATPEDVRAEHATIAADSCHHAWLGRLDGRPLVLAETYDPRERVLAGHWDAEAGDVGMHLLVAPPEPGEPAVPGLTSTAVAAVVRLALAQPGARRVVVEPDEQNAAVRAKNRAAGFVEHGLLALPGKTAVLSTCTREAFARSELGRLVR